ncbi:MAG: GNAT family N-acetyltransferase [Nocardioides sp.]|uniref:GNAT family N-acetyltransferase n=1 Tax=Nocardioides sp. TaxID=35761 RepID=UPI003EFCAC38
MSDSVTRHSDPTRFQITIGDHDAGHVEFVDHERARVFFHTEVNEDYSGHGLGGALVQRALELTRDEGLRIVAFCPFVKAYINRNPEWLEYVNTPTAGAVAAIPR